MHPKSITPDREIAVVEAFRRHPLLWRPPGFSYHQRDAFLRGMGYATYKLYLTSGLWGMIREWAFAARGRLCWACRWRRPATQVHHRIYTAANLCGRLLDGLRPVCQGCHAAMELEPDGSKRRQGQVDDEALKIRWSLHLSVIVRREAPEQ